MSKKLDILRERVHDSLYTRSDDTLLTAEEIFAHLPPLETDRLLLRRMMMCDAADLFAYSSDPKVAEHVLWEPHQSIRDTRSYIRCIRRMYRMGLPSSYSIVLKETGTVIGTIGIMWYHPAYRSAEIGYSLSREYWGRGLMTEAVGALLRFGFEKLKLHRIEAMHETSNPASGRVMEKCGMRKEGILRDRVFNKGHFSDVALYAILETDRTSDQEA